MLKGFSRKRPAGPSTSDQVAISSLNFACRRVVLRRGRIASERSRTVLPFTTSFVTDDLSAHVPLTRSTRRSERNSRPIEGTSEGVSSQLT